MIRLARILPPCLLALALALVPAGGQEESWTANDAMLSFFGAMRKLQDNATPQRTVAEWTQLALRALMKETDAYGEYLDPAQYRLMRESQQSSYGGIGVELRKKTDGSLVCLPWPGGPADLKGLRDDDILLAINGTPVGEMEPRDAAALIRGDSDTPAVLLVQTSNQPPRELVVLRSKIKAKTVRSSLDKGVFTARIYAFESSTPRELREALAKRPLDEPVALDLRGNQGGSLFDAVDAARLFLPKDSVLLAVRRRDGEQIFRAEEDGPFPMRTLFLLQDTETASAAEVFIAALTGNRRAESFGETTFGKGVTQQIFPLMDGGALILTDGELSGPGGLSWNGRGLPPTRSEAASEVFKAVP